MIYTSCVASAGILICLAASSVFGQMTVVNGSSFSAGQGVAPGSIATIFGQNLCSTQAAAPSAELPAQLGGCTVSVNGMPAQLYYVSPGQINFVAPQGIAPGSASLTVQNGTQTLSGSMNVASAAPGIFSANGIGVGMAAMLQGATFQPGPFSVTTNGSPTPVSMFVTGMDLSSAPVVTIGGVPATVTFYGPQPVFPGMQQINFTIPGAAAGAGDVPVTISSGGQASNLTFMEVLPTTAMMQGMPGFSSGSQVAENTARPDEPVDVAFNGANNTVLISDRAANVVRIMNPNFSSTAGAITLPQNAEARGIAVNDAGTTAAVAMSGLNAVALIDLVENRISATIGVDVFPVRVAFAGNNLMVTNAGSDTVSVIDVNSRTISHTVKVGHGPWGIAADAANNRAVVANMQSGTVSTIDLSSFAATEISLPSGMRPYGVAISPAANQAVITAPTTNSVVLMNLADNSLRPMSTDSNGQGPSAVAINANTAYIANMMSASVVSMDVNSGTILNTATTDPGPRSLAMAPQGNSMFVLAQGTQTVNMMNLTGGGGMVMGPRMGGTGGTPGPAYGMPLVTSVSPKSAKPGTTFTLTVSGSNLSGVNNVDFAFMGPSGMGPGQGPRDDTGITSSSIQVNSSGTQLTAVVSISSSATPGTRVIHLDTPNGDVMMGGGPGALFTVSAP